MSESPACFMHSVLSEEQILHGQLEGEAAEAVRLCLSDTTEQGLAVHLFSGEDLFWSHSVPRGPTQLRAEPMLREGEWWYCTSRRMSALIRLKFTPNKIKSAEPRKLLRDVTPTVRANTLLDRSQWRH